MNHFYDTAFSVKKDRIECKAHKTRMNGIAGNNEQSFARKKAAFSQQATQTLANCISKHKPFGQNTTFCFIDD